MDWNNKSLKVLSLTETEKKILNVLDFPKTVQEISQESKISRTGINHVLKHLLNKDLIKYELVGKRKKYISINLLELSRKFQQILDQIQMSNKEKKGARIKVSQENEFVIHIGKEEIIPAYKRIAFENKNERVKAIQHHRSWNELIEKISPEQLVEFNEAIKENKIILDGMLNESAYTSYQQEIKSNPEKHKEAVRSLEGRMADYAVFSDEFFNYDAEIWIFNTTALIINWKEELAIEITNENMTGFLRDMFEFVKKGGRKLNHNEAIRELINKGHNSNIETLDC